MKTMQKFILSGLMFGMLSTPVEGRLEDVVVPVLATTAVAAIIYYSVDSNETLLRKANQYIHNVDTCQDLLPATTLNNSIESYFEQYVQNKFGVRVIDINLGSDSNYHIVSNYISKQKNNVYAARQCVEFRSTFFNEMSHELAKIKSLELLLTQASVNAQHYENFLLGHQVLNFHANLPTNDTSWLSLYDTQQQQQAAMIKWVRRGYYSNDAYPLMSYVEQLSRDLKFLRQYLGYNSSYTIWYPKLSAQLKPCQESLETAFDLIIDSSAYQAEKDAKHKEEILLAEQAKARAAAAAAYAQQQQAYAQRDQAYAQADQSWAQHRQANAQEEANRIARAAQNKKK